MPLRPRELFVADGRIRSLWRILLFAGFFVTADTLLWIAAAVAGPRTIEVRTLVSLIAALLAAWAALRLLDRRPFRAAGYAWTSGTWRELGSGTLIGVLGLGCAVALLAASGTLAYAGDDGTAVSYGRALGADLALFAVAGAAEEAVFRGYPFQVLVQGVGAWPATLLASAAFAAAHAQNPSVDALALGNIFFAGVLLSVAYLRTRSLWFATALHVGWNWAQATLFDLPVSGLAHFDTPLYEPVLRGPGWWTGGEFGPEGGLVGAAAIGVMLLLVYRWRVLRPAPEQAEIGLLVDHRLGVAGGPPRGEDGGQGGG